MNIELIYEDKNFLALNKPAGLLVHGVPGGDEQGTMVQFLLEKFPEVKNVGDEPEIRPGIVHRLDKDTSGVILVPRNQDYFRYLKNLFQKHEIRKTYIALVHGKTPKSGIIDKPIGLKPGTTRRTVFVKDAKMVKSAETAYELKEHLKIEGEDYSLLSLYPKTGRTHQIRIHLASIGHPVVGDKLYGRKNERGKGGRLLLHADSIEFEKAPHERIRLSSDLPEEFQELIDKAS